MALQGWLSGRAIMLGLLVSCIIWYNVIKFARVQKIKKLGGFTRILKLRTPFGLSLPYFAIMHAKRNTVYEWWMGMFESAGCLPDDNYTFEFDIVNTRVIFTADPENIKAILTSQFADYGKGEKFHEEWRDFLGDSIFTTDTQRWHDSRQLIRPMFMRERVADLELVEEHVAKLLRLIGSGDGNMVRLDKLLSRFSLDASTHFLFGHSAGSLDDEEARFGVAFDEVQRVQALNVRGGVLSFAIPQGTFRAGLKTMEEFITPWINETLDLSPAELEAKLSRSDTFIHALARHTRDRKVIRDQLVSLLLAGRDTTSSTLSWLFLELARNPQVVQKLRDEIQNVVGIGRRPTYENIKDMKYLTAIINETLRLYSVVPYNVRTSLKDTTLPRGGGPDGMSPVGVLKGTPIGYSTLVLHRRKDLYPPISENFPYDPMIWEPDRWATWTPKSWQFIPFNGGPRICIGQQFAMVEMGYTIIRIFQEYSKIIDYGNDMVLKTDILLTPAGGVKVGFLKASTDAEKGR